MAKQRSNTLGKILGTWVATVTRHAIMVIILALLLSVVTLHFTVSHLGMITNTSDMLSRDLHYLKVHRAFKKAFPQLNNTIVVVIDGQTPDLAIDARDRLARNLSLQKALFKSVYVPGGDLFFRKNGLLYLSVDDLEKLADQIAAVQPLLAELVREQNIKGFFSLLHEALDADKHDQEIDLEPVFKQISRVLEAALADRFYQLSWMQLMNGSRSDLEKQKRVFIVLQPNLDYNRLLPGKLAMQTIRQAAGALDLDSVHGVRVRMTGDIAMEFEELQSVTRGAKIAGWLSLFMVSIVLFLGLRSFKLVAAALITLIFGLIWTAGFAALAVGHLNMISMAFAVLFIGLAVDFAIHFCLRCRELLSAGTPLPKALTETARDVGASLVLCAVTTSIGFYAFIPTEFSGVAELGLISGTGMFIGLIANLTLLPALLMVMRLGARLPSAASRVLKTTPPNSMPSFFMRHCRMVRITTLLAALGAIALLPLVSYDRNPLNLRDPSSESVATFRELLAQDDHSPWSLKVLAPDKAAAIKTVSLISPLKEVKAVVTINDFVPTDQQQKLDLVEEIDYIAGPSLIPNAPPGPGPTYEEKLSAIKTFSRRLGLWIEAKGPQPGPASASVQLADQLKFFLTRLASTDSHSGHELMTALSASLLGSLPGRLEALQHSLQAASIGIKDLPADLVRRWVTRDGRYRLEILPRQNLNDSQHLINFITAVRKVAPDATGYPVVIHEGSIVVANAFKKAFTFSLVAIALILLVLMPKKSDAFLVLLPLVLSALFTGACMAILDLPLNFANIIALPLILGIGVDNGIHMVHRYHTVNRNQRALMHSSTVRSIIFATLTTICSFGNLAASPHLGMASMGKLLTIGISASLVCTLVVLPAFFPKDPIEAAETMPQDIKVS